VPDHKNIVEMIFTTIDELNELLPPAQQLEKSVDTVVFGADGKLDSLGLVTLIVAVEQKIMETFNVTLTLADEKAMSQRNSPFRSIGTLAGYIEQLLGENSND
jgi:acyl carrier protein